MKLYIVKNAVPKFIEMAKQKTVFRNIYVVAAKELFLKQLTRPLIIANFRLKYGAMS